MRIQLLKALAALCVLSVTALGGETATFIEGPAGLKVDAYTGQLRLENPMIQVPAPGLDLELGLSYNSELGAKDMGFGSGWLWSLHYAVDATADGVTVTYPDGDQYYFPASGDAYKSPAGITDTLTGRDGKFTLTTRQGTAYRFHAKDHQRLTSIVDRNGNTISLGYAAGLPVTVTDVVGRVFNLHYLDGRLQTIEDLNAKPNRTYELTYDGRGRLTQTQRPTGETLAYSYDDQSRMTALTDARGNTVTLAYDSEDRVIAIEGHGTYLGIQYDDAVTHVSGSDGKTFLSYGFDKQGRCTSQNGRVPGLNRTLVYDANHNVISETDGAGNTIESTYNNRGDRTARYDALGNAEYFAYSTAHGQLTSYTNREGHTWTITLDTKGNPIVITHPDGTTELFTYNAEGQMMSRQDNDGDVYTYGYDAHGNWISFSDAMGTTMHTYDDVGNRISTVDAVGNETQFTYDALDRLVVQRDALGETNYTYDANGNITSETNGEGHTVTYSYNARDLLTRKTLPEGNGASYSYDERGNLTRKTDGLGHKYDYTYSDTGLLTSEILRPAPIATQQDPTGTQSQTPTQTGKAPTTLKTYSYTPSGRLATVTLTGGLTTVITYNGNYWPLHILFPDGTANTYTYNNNGSPTSVTTPNGNTTVFTYNATEKVIDVSDNHGNFFSYNYSGGLVSSASDGDGATISYTYNAKKKPTSRTDALGNTATYNYDAAGRMTSATNRNGVTTSYTYDAKDRITSTTEGNGTTIYRNYDANGNVISRIDAEGQTTYYNYDSNDRNTSIIYPDGNIKSFAFDANDNIISRTDQGGAVINFAYDAQNRVIARDFPGTNDDSYSYDASGRMLSAVNNNAVVNFTYDPNGRLTSESIDGLVTSYSHDIANGVVTTTYPSGKSIDNIYDGRGRLDEVREGGNLVTDYHYSTMGDIYRQDFGNGTYMDRTSNANNLPTNITHGPGAFATFNYTYDNEFFVQTAEKLHRPLNSHKYTYDADNQLTSFEEGYLYGGQIYAPVRDAVYTYDNNANRSALTWSGINVTYTDNNLSQITQIAYLSTIINPTYDSNGNQTWDGAHVYAYDTENRMISVDGGATASYSYDALGRRLSKTTASGTTDYYYAGNRVIEERDGGAVTANYIYGHHMDEVLRMDRGGGEYYYHRDHQGSVVALTDDSGAVVERYEYAAYGLVTIYDAAYNALGASAVGNPYLFTSRRLDTETGHYFYRARNYDSLHGRFMQRDPYGYIDSMNPYAYVRNNPVNYVDPTGEWLGALVGAVVGAVVGGVTAAVTGGDVVAGAVGGAVTGALVGSGVPPAIAGAAGGAVSGAISGAKKGGVEGAITGAVVGAAAGAAAGAVAGGIGGAISGEGAAAGAGSAFTTGAANTATTLTGALGEAIKGGVAPTGHAATIIVTAGQMYYVDLPLAMIAAIRRLEAQQQQAYDQVYQYQNR